MARTGDLHNEDVFTELTLGWGDDARQVIVAPAEQAVLAASAGRYTQQHDMLAAQGRDWVAAMYAAGSGSVRYEFPLEARHLGDGYDAVAFACDIEGETQVMRVPNTPVPAGKDWSQMNAQRLLAMARSHVHDVPHVERLVAHTQALGRQAVFATQGMGKPTKFLEPEEIAAIPAAHVSRLWPLAHRLAAAGLSIDVDLSDDSLALLHCNAVYSQAQGPFFCDLLPIEAISQQPFTADQHYAYLVHDLVSSYSELGGRHLSPMDAAARLILLEQARLVIAGDDEYRAGQRILERTMHLITEDVNKGDFVDSCKVMGIGGTSADQELLYVQTRLTGQSPVNTQKVY
ncbi:MAG TPA: hypothetical protein VLI54_00180 [Bacillota bacterium]|nr:hypothetical protein [Bacillota bacterium]